MAQPEMFAQQCPWQPDSSYGEGKGEIGKGPLSAFLPGHELQLTHTTFHFTPLPRVRDSSKLCCIVIFKNRVFSVDTSLLIAKNSIPLYVPPCRA